jgi:hypothetical protein
MHFVIVEPSTCGAYFDYFQGRQLYGSVRQIPRQVYGLDTGVKYTTVQGLTKGFAERIFICVAKFSGIISDINLQELFLPHTYL